MTTSASDKPLIAFISATPAAIGPARDAFAEIVPNAVIWNILDDRLQDEVDLRGGLTPELQDRMSRLIEHAVAEGADGILLTCSLYGSVANTVAAQIDVPLLAADESAFSAVVDSHYKSVLVLSSAAAPLEDSINRLGDAASTAGSGIDIAGVVAEGAFAAARSGDPEALASVLADAVIATGGNFEVVLLSQYSLAPAAEILERRLNLPVISGPHRAAKALLADLSRTKDPS